MMGNNTLLLHTRWHGRSLGHLLVTSIWIYITGYILLVGILKKKTNYSKEVYSLLSPKRHKKPHWKKRILKNKLASCFRKI